MHFASDKEKETRAHEFLDERRYREAAELFIELAESGYNTADCYQNAGMCLEYNQFGIRRGEGANLESAKRCYELSLNCGTKNKSDVLLGIATIEFSQGNYFEAKNKSMEAVEISPANFQLHGVLGAANSKLGNHKAAVKSLKHALELNPSDYTAMYNLGYSLASLGHDRDALAAYQMFCDRVKEILHLTPIYNDMLPSAQREVERLNTKLGGKIPEGGSTLDIFVLILERLIALTRKIRDG